MSDSFPTATVSAFRTTPSTKTTQTGFGLKLGCPLRDRWVDRNARLVHLTLDGFPGPLEVRLRGGFWNQCAEFMHERIHDWIVDQGLPIPWPRGRPHQFRIERICGTQFLVRRWNHHSPPSA